MPENGTKVISMFQFVGGVIAGVVSIIIAIYMLVYAPLLACAKDAEAKAEHVAEKLVKTTQEQGTVNTQILVTLAEIKGNMASIQQDIGYIKKEVNK